MIANVATMEVGIASPGMIVARRFLRKTKMITTTRPAAMSRVSSASWMERCTKIDWSNAVSMLTPGGSDAWIRGSSRPDQLGHLDDVGLGLPHHADRDRGGAVVAQRAPLVLRTQFDPAQVAQLDQHPAGVAHRQVGELLRGLELAQATGP